jgi:hypothetical protein
MARANLLLTGCLAAIAMSACATMESAGPVPKQFGFARRYQGAPWGYAFRAAYFTEAEMRDPRWEEWRQSAGRQMRICNGGHRLLRRDVRWYPATPLSGRRCAAVVYTMRCAHPVANTGADRVEEYRRFSLDIADPPPGPNCGDKYAPERILRPFPPPERH